MSFGMCHFCVGVAAGWWVTVCHLGCVTFALVWLRVSHLGCHKTMGCLGSLLEVLMLGFHEVALLASICFERKG